MDNIARFELSFIKDRRKALGITNQKMAEKLNFKNASTYFKYENGTYHFKATHLPTIAEALQCSMDDFYTLEDEELKKN